LLRFKGGKSVAVTYGVLLALPQHEILISFIAFMVLGFLFVEADAWTVMVGPAGSLTYLAITGAGSWEKIFMAGVFVMLAVKHLNELKTMPTFRGRLISWLQSRRPEA
jgi:glycerol-3-phosphate acyltransferase PlsY